ncbi:MAG: PAS domain S-box protein [Deltaproteobacteria bacterium]|nr:PAS domain S-box protein [Deltaproteobacteria bacterium]
MRDEATSFARQRRARIARRFGPFAVGWAGMLLLWLGVFALEGRLTSGAVAAAGAGVGMLAIAGWITATRPTTPWLLPVTVATCTGLGLDAGAMVHAVGGYGEIVAFMLLTLYLVAALIFGWGWRAESVLLAGTLVPSALVLERFPSFVPRPELGAAVAIGAVVALAIAEGTARDMRQVARRRRAQETAVAALQASRDAYRDLAERAPDMIWSCDRDGRLTYVNEALAAFVGLPAAAVLGRSAVEFWTAHGANPDFATLLASGTAPDEPIRIQCVTPRGPRWVEAAVSTAYDEDGATVGFRGVSRDVQERYDADAALRASEERFRSSFDHALIGMAVVDLDGRVVEVNRSFATMLGYVPEALVGRRMDTLVHPEDVARATEQTERLLSGRISAFEMEKRYWHRDGHVVWGLLGCSLTRDTLGEPRHLLAQVQDISERKAAETALRESEARYRGLVESQHELVVRLDQRGRFTFVNEAYAAAFDRPPAALLGISFLDLVHPDDHALVAEMIATMIRPPHRAYVEIRNLMATGVRWVGWEAGVVDSSGQIFEAQAVGRDVTERRAAEEALHASVAELRRSEEKLRLLARRQATIREEERKRVGFDLHDDVCQELVGIGILVESLRRRLGPMPAEVGAEFDRVGRYVGEVVEHLRLLARELRPFLLREVGLAGSLRSLVDGMTSPRLAVTIDLETPIPRLDEETEVSVYRIAQEALTNAVRHAGARAIVIALAAVDGTLVLRVRDDGHGFDPAAKPAAALGLASMEERALALGGRLDVRSEPGAGTTVTLRSPLDARRGTPVRERAGSSPTRSSSPPSRATTPRAAARD